VAPNRYYTSDAVPTTLAASLLSVTPGATGSVQVASITGYPVSFPFTLLLDWGTSSQEVVTVTQAATGSGPYTYAACVRGDDGTLAPAHTAPMATVVHGVSARDFTDPQTHLGSSSGVHGVTGALAPLASPAFTGTPTAPTASPLTSSIQLATTAYTDSAVTAGQPSTGTPLALTKGGTGQDAASGTALLTALGAGTAALQASTAFDAAGAAAAAQAASTPVLTQATVLTASGTASANTIVPVNTTSGNVTVTLPSAPPAGTMVAVKHIIQGGSNTVTIACAGTDVLDKAGGSTSSTLTLASQGKLLAYGAGIWINLADDLPLTQTDARYLNQNTTGTAAGFTGNLAGDVTGTQAATAVGQIQGVAVTAAEAALVSDLNNATTRTATATLLPGEETVFTGSTAAQTLTLPATPPSSSLNTVTNAATVPVSLAAGAGATLSSYGTAGSITVPAGYTFAVVYIGTTWYVQQAGPSDFAKNGVLSLANGGTGLSEPSAPALLAALGAAQVFSPLAYGAAGNGTTDDTTALQNCVAAAHTAGGIVDLGTYTFKTSSPINVTSGLYMRGCAPAGGSIVSSASDIFTIASTADNVRFANCTFTSNTGGGHIWNASSGPTAGRWTITGCYLTQSNAAKCIWYQNQGLILNFTVDGNGMMISSASATVSPWTIVNSAGANVLEFSDTTCQAGSGTTVPFFLIDSGYSAHTPADVGMTAGSPTVTTASAAAADVGLSIYSTNFTGSSAVISSVTPGTGYVVSKNATATLSAQTCLVGNRGRYHDAIFRNITWEVCAGGGVAMTGGSCVLIDSCYNYDIGAAGLKGNFYSFTQSKLGSGASYTGKPTDTYYFSDIQVRGGESGGSSTTGSGFSDLYADATSMNIRIDSFGCLGYGAGGIPAVISSPAAQTTITNPTVTLTSGAPVSTFPGPVAVTGTTGASAGGRYVGATASGAPTTGTFLAGDFCNDQAGSLWVCTAGGTPGTWVSGGGAPTAPSVQLFTTSGTWTKGAAKTVFVAAIPGGSGGGSGASGTSATVQCGGGGGGAGPFVQRQFAAADLTSTVTVTVGAGGLGGASVTGTTGNTAGNNGAAASGTSSFGSYLYTPVGGVGAGGTTTSGTGGGGAFGITSPQLGTGASASTTGGVGATTAPAPWGPPSGPSGGGITSGAAASAGAAGQISMLTVGTAGTAGVVGGASPGQGVAGLSTSTGLLGPSAGSGAASTTGAAQAGANALANTGAGGAGGGASLNGNASGAGGNGGSGWVLVVAYFQ